MMIVEKVNDIALWALSPMQASACMGQTWQLLEEVHAELLLKKSTKTIQLS